VNLFDRGLKKSRESWFGRVKNLFDRPTIGDDVWTELEELLIAADVGMTTTEKLLSAVKQRVRDEKIKDGAQVQAALQEEMIDLLKIDYTGAGNGGAVPKVTLVVGVNGSGKTTSIAKLASRSRKEGRKVMLVAADTFRAAAIDQLKRWGDVADAEVIAHQPGADPGAVVYDALAAARSRGVQEVIIDTAGRLHTKFNLMEELKKVKRVASKNDATAPHEVLLVMDATTGQNGLAQAKHFTEAVNVTSIFLAKLDGTAKGGIVLAVCDELKIPVRYIGVGEKLEDMADFDASRFVEALFA
jgi:fused signal recognition particle receptor